MFGSERFRVTSVEEYNRRIGSVIKQLRIRFIEQGDYLISCVSLAFEDRLGALEQGSALRFAAEQLARLRGQLR